MWFVKLVRNIIGNILSGELFLDTQPHLGDWLADWEDIKDVVAEEESGKGSEPGLVPEVIRCDEDS